jgi:hypothetical protein
LIVRRRVLDKYGGRCKCCGESTYEFLAFDHINGGGVQHRKTIGKDLYIWLHKNKYPEGFQVLCHNCNNAKGFYGQCPHIKERDAEIHRGFVDSISEQMQAVGH